MGHINWRNIIKRFGRSVESRKSIPTRMRWNRRTGFIDPGYRREFKELDKLYKKSGFTKLSQQEQRRLERLEALSQDNKKGVEKEKWVMDKIVRGKSIHIQPKTHNQDLFLQSMRDNIITIGSGSSGTGKTYLACYYAASELLSGNIDKIVITRPYVAVSGRTTGFKPNTDIEKLRGFVLPMLGYLSEVLGADYVETQIQNYGTVELSPLESIRGRSFDNAIVISDESSNMTVGEIQAPPIVTWGKH